MLLQVFINLCNQVLILGQLFFSSGSKAVDLNLKKFMEDRDIKNEMFMSTIQSVQKVNEGQLQLIKDLSQQIGKMSPPQCEPSTGYANIYDDVDSDESCVTDLG